MYLDSDLITYFLPFKTTFAAANTFSQIIDSIPSMCKKLSTSEIWKTNLLKGLCLIRVMSNFECTLKKLARVPLKNCFCKCIKHLV